MKKETFFVFAIGLFILAYVIDYISGPVSIIIKNPFQYLDPTILSKFPLTTVGVICRSIGIFISVLLLWSLFDRIYMVKAVTTFLLSALFELFAIQQIATGMRTVTIQWILSLAYTGILLLLPVIIYVIKHFLPTVPTIVTNNTNEDEST